MRFDQAFHYRDINSGWGTYASSDSSNTFKKTCGKICEGFAKEDGCETAEFVLYSNEFGRFVGIGVIPFESRDRANRLVQIWVPEEASAAPSDYYLEYEFAEECDIDRQYEKKEFEPCISEQDYSEILARYGFSKDRLAKLLSMTMPILFDSYEKLSVVFPQNRFSKEEKRAAAREIMWLISVLMPVPEDKRSEFGSRLSYSVFSEKNRKKAAVSFVDSVPASGSCYMLEGEETLPDSDEENALYYELAEKAMESLESYRGFIRELTDCGFEEGEFDRDILDVMYFYRELRCGRITEIEKENLPIDFEGLVFKARTSKGYCDFLFRVLAAPNDLTNPELGRVYSNIFGEDNIWSGNDAGDLRGKAEAAFGEMLEKTFESGNRSAFYKLLEIKDPDLKREVLTDLWQKKGEDSCIAGDIKEIGDVDTFLNKLSFYKDLAEDDGFRKQMCSVLFGKNLYFKMDKKERSSVSSLLDQGTPAFVSWIRRKIEELFHSGFEAGLSFFNKEKYLLEDKFAADYFQCFVENCRNADPEFRKEVQKTGHEFIDAYSGSIRQEDKADFRDIDRNWKRNDIEETLKRASLGELAAFKFDDFKDYSLQDQNDYVTMWLKEVRSRIRDDSQSDRNENGVASDVFKKLVKRNSDLSRDYPEAADEFREMLWNACGSDMQRKILCANEFGTAKYMIWSSDLLNDKVYEEIRKADDSRVENKKIPENRAADLNRRCYLLWKSAGRLNQIDTKTLRALSEEADQLHLQAEWTALVENMMDRARGELRKGSYNSGVNYLHLYAELLRDCTVDDRCADYESLYGKDPVSYRNILSLLGNYRGEDADYIREMECLKGLWDIGEVNEENLEKTAGLLDKAEKLFGEKSAPIHSTQIKFENAMNSLVTACNEIDKKAGSIKSYNEKLWDQIQQNEAEIDRMLADKRRKEELADRARQKRKGTGINKMKVEPLPKGIQNDLDSIRKERRNAQPSMGKKSKKLGSTDASMFMKRSK